MLSRSFLSPASRLRSLLSEFISVTSTVSPDIPPALKCLSARRAVGAPGYKPALQAPVRVRRVVHRQITESPLSLSLSPAGRRGIRTILQPSAYNVGIRESPPRLRFDIPLGATCGLSPKSDGFWLRHAACSVSE